MEQPESDKKKPKKTTKIKTTDGGWGWMCVMGSFLLHTYLAGHQKSFSLLYIVMRQRFESSAAFTAWVGGTSIAVRMMCSPIANMLCKRYTTRPVLITGAILQALGMGLGCFATSTAYMFVTYSLIAGFGGSLCFAPCLVTVTRWFDKRRTLATGLASSGAGFGSFLFPPMVEFLLFYYGFRGTMLVLGGVGLNCLISGIVMKDHKPETLLLSTTKMEASAAPLVHKEDNLNVTCINECKPSVEDNMPQLRETKLNVVKCDEKVRSLENGESSTECLQELSEKKLVISQQPANGDVAPVSVETAGVKSPSRSRLARCSAMFGCEIWTNRAFVLFAFCQGCLSMSQVTSHMLVSALAIEMGYSVNQAAWLLVITGISDTASRLISGFLLDLQCLRGYRFACWLLMLALYCCATFVKPFAPHYVVLATACAVSGMGAGCIISQRPVIAYELLGSENLESSVGFSIAVQGSLVLIGPVIAGFFRDVSSTYTASFVFCGFIAFVSFCFFFAIYQLKLKRATVSQSPTN